MTVSASAGGSHLDAEIGERVYMLLFRQHKTQNVLGRALGLNQAGIARRLRGETAWKATDLASAAAELGTSITYLVGEGDDEWAPRGSNPRPADYKGVVSPINRITFADFPKSPERTAA